MSTTSSDLDRGLVLLRSTWNTTNKLSLQAKRRCQVFPTSVAGPPANKITSGMSKRMEFLNQFPASKGIQSAEISDTQSALLLAQRSGDTLDQIVGNLHKQLHTNMHIVTASKTYNWGTPQKMHSGGLGRGKIRTQGVRVLSNTTTNCRDVSKPVPIPMHLVVQCDEFDGVLTNIFHSVVAKVKGVVSAVEKKVVAAEKKVVAKVKGVVSDVENKAKEVVSDVKNKIHKMTETPTTAEEPTAEDTPTEKDPLAEAEKNADVVVSVAKFARLPLSSSQYLHYNTPVAVGCRSVNVVDICNDIPISYSAGFQLSPGLVKNVNAAVKFAQQDMQLHVHKVVMLVGDKNGVGANKNCISDSVVFTPRKVGGSMLYTQSIFAHSDDTRALTKKNEATHILDSIPNESKHVVYGVNMPDVLDTMTTRVSDCAQNCADTWVHTMCENDKSKLEAIHQNGHMPTIHLVTTAHSTHTCPIRGVSVHVQRNNFRCAAPAIGRYVPTGCKTLDLEISSVALFFHGPLVDVHV